MSTLTTSSAKPNKTPQASATAMAAVKKASPPNAPPPAHQCASKEARRIAAAILEVLAGMRTPPDAAQALGVTVPRYYVLEQRGLAALVSSCERRTQGPQHTPERELARLGKEIERLQRAGARQQALVRWAQRTVGLAAPPTDSAKAADKKGKRKPKKPVVRALKAAARLQLDDTPQEANLAPSVNGAGTVEGAKEVSS